MLYSIIFFCVIFNYRSNRTCQRWLANAPHVVKENHLNESSFSDRNLSAVENYCRDPSNNIGGIVFNSCLVIMNIKNN